MVFILHRVLYTWFIMIQVDLSKAFLAQAIEQASQMRVYNNSYRGNDANLVGLIGELVVEDWFRQHGINFIPEKRTDYDYRISHDNRTIDVKTKERGYDPQSSYDCSVPLYNKQHQIPDYYLYVSLTRCRNMAKDDPYRFQRAFILGGINQHGLHKNGLIWRRGQVDPSNKTKFWTDCLNVYVHQLTSPNDVIRSLQENRPEVKVWTQRILHKLKVQGQEAICHTGFQESLRRDGN